MGVHQLYVLNNDPLQKVLAKTKDNEKITQVLANMGHAYSELGDDARAGECWDAALHVRPLPAKPQVSSWWRNPFGFIRERPRALRSEDDLPAQRQ